MNMNDVIGLVRENKVQGLIVVAEELPDKDGICTTSNLYGTFSQRDIAELGDAAFRGVIAQLLEVSFSEFEIEGVFSSAMQNVQNKRKTQKEATNDQT